VNKPSIGFTIGLVLLLQTFASTAGAQLSQDQTLAAFAPRLAAGDKPIELAACTSTVQTISGVLASAFKCTGAQIETAVSVSNSRLGPQVIKLSLDSNKRFRIAGKSTEFGALQSVHQVDLNGDSKPDFLLELGDSQKQLLFLLSSAQGYDWQMITQQRSPSTSHLYKDAEGRKILLTTRFLRDAFRPTTKSQSAISGAFLVYDIVRFSVADNQFVYVPSDNFPVWVAFEANAKGFPGSLHKPTSTVPRDQMRKVTRAPLDKQRGGRMQILG
jgi:hypothetical protein